MKLLIGGPSRVRRVLVGLVLASVVLAGCSGSKADDGGQRASAPEPAGASKDDAAAGTSTTPATSKKAGSSGGKSGGNSGGKSSPTTSAPKAGDSAAVDEGASKATDKEDPYKKTLDIKAELAESCVRPGGSQSITIRTLPNAGVGYDTQYSDYLTGMMEGHYGGNSANFTDPEGTFQDTWVIAPNAPAGEAIVLVLGSHHEGGMGETRVSFKVADALGKCS